MKVERYTTKENPLLGKGKWVLAELWTDDQQINWSSFRAKGNNRIQKTFCGITRASMTRAARICHENDFVFSPIFGEIGWSASKETV